MRAAVNRSPHGTRESGSPRSPCRRSSSGAEDPATPVEHADFLASRIPGARLLVLERAAHLANVERADEFTVAVLDHLGQEVPVER